MRNGASRAHFWAALACFSAILLFSGGAAEAQEPQNDASEVVVRAAAYYKYQGTCGGSVSPVYLKAEPNPRGKIQLGFFESSAEAIGAQSKASGWMAALVSTELLDEDLSKYRISISRTDLIDGPSAGALMTSGMVALLRGDSFPADASMTGTINPDGTVGPVGGIPHKVLGASESGIKRFGIPQGQRRDYNICTGEVEDVVEIGRALGVEVVEIGDIREAYRFFTGIALPEPPSEPISVEVSEDLRAEYRSLFKTWQARYQSARQMVASVPDADFPGELKALWRDGENSLESGQQALRSDSEPTAFYRVWLAVLNAEFVARGVRAMGALRSRGIPGAQATVEREISLTEEHFAAELSELKGTTFSSVADAGAVAMIGSNLATGLAFFDQAKAELAQSMRLAQQTSGADPAEIVLLAFEALSHLTLAELQLDGAMLSKNWIGRGGQPWNRTSEPIRNALTLYASAARSNIRYVDVLYTERVAKQRQMNLAAATDWVLRKDITYLAAVGALNQQYGFSDLFDDSFVVPIAQLGALMGSVANASLLVAQQYSVRVKTDKLGRITDIGDEPALERMLALAERAAGQATSEADVATDGASTPMLVVAIDAARRNRDQPVTSLDKFVALGMYWSATLNARLMTRLARAR